MVLDFDGNERIMMIVSGHFHSDSEVAACTTARLKVNWRRISFTYIRSEINALGQILTKIDAEYIGEREQWSSYISINLSQWHG